MKGYDKINALKRQLRSEGIKANIPDLLSLSSNNDPFYAGTPTDVLKSEWFGDIWTKAEYKRGVHIRRVHYLLVNHREAPKKHDGTPYENEDNDWEYINVASKEARYLNQVDPDNFVDRRNPDPKLFTGVSDSIDPCTELRHYGWRAPRIYNDLTPAIHIPGVDVEGYDYSIEDQGYHLELWIEKSTMDDELIPVCRRLGINLVTSKGFQSITNVLGMIDRVLHAGKPARIFYISDFDPGGDDMPVAVARQVEFWLQEHSNCDIKLEHLLLTESQCIEYDLPRIPIKKKDRRKDNFENRFGVGATELDALEAIHPGELGRIVREAAEPYIDDSLPSGLAETGDEVSAEINEVWAEMTKPEQQQLDDIIEDINQVTSRYQE